MLEMRPAGLYNWLLVLFVSKLILMEGGRRGKVERK